MNEKVGPFFVIGNRLIYHACPLSEAREQFGRLDNSYGHEQLYDDYYQAGDYIDYPRGRVIWDTEGNRAIIYIDPCIRKPGILKRIAEAFSITDYVVEGDEHYHCKKCLGAIWD